MKSFREGKQEKRSEGLSGTRISSPVSHRMAALSHAFDSVTTHD